MKVLPDSIEKWLPGTLTSLGTDGYGRSETRTALRDYFEVSAKYIVQAAIYQLASDNKMTWSDFNEIKQKLEINPAKLNPLEK